MFPNLSGGAASQSSNGPGVAIGVGVGMGVDICVGTNVGMLVSSVGTIEVSVIIGTTVEAVVVFGVCSGTSIFV
ncbi:MAG: hypothetical protein VX523_03425 [Chloroflexota bacterium]|nr:hypothetical protein [Chloroflexota bacterium]